MTPSTERTILTALAAARAVSGQEADLTNLYLDVATANDGALITYYPPV